MAVGGQEAGAGRCAGACGWRCRCLLAVVTGSKVTCEGTALEEVWSELEGGTGAAGQRTPGSRKVGLVLPRTGELGLPWQEELRRKPAGSGKEERACFSWDEGK